MKKLFLLLFSQLVLCLAIFAQNTETQMDDLERVAISVNLTDCKLDSNAKEVLNSKLLQLISSNGLGHIGEGAIFYLKPIISLVSRNVTSTQPIYNVCVIEISLSIEDRFEGNIYGNIKSKYKGVGKSEADAYAKAINKIDTRNRAYRAFI